jgi:hypothetical protein
MKSAVSSGVEPAYRAACMLAEMVGVELEDR